MTNFLVRLKCKKCLLTVASRANSIKIPSKWNHYLRTTTKASTMPIWPEMTNQCWRDRQAATNTSYAITPCIHHMTNCQNDLRIILKMYHLYFVCVKYVASSFVAWGDDKVKSSSALMEE